MESVMEENQPSTRPLSSRGELSDALQKSSGRMEVNGENVRNGLGQLVLTLIRLLHELLEKQAIRRMESGSLDEEEIDRLGTTLMKQAEEIDRLRELLELKEEDLNMDLGPLGRLI